MKNKTKLRTIGAAVLLSIMLTGCAERGTQSDDPAAFAKRTYSYSISNNNESKPSEESSGAVTINGDVMWGIGKTFDEVEEKYGSSSGMGKFHIFENGYGKYVFENGCNIIGDIPAKDFLVGDISTVTLDNIAEKCGFNVVPLNDTDDPNTMYEGYREAYYTHPSYENITFEMLYNESGFDDSALFRVTLDRVTPAITDEFINTLNSVIDSAADVEALKSGIKNADADALIFGVRVFENTNAFEKNTRYSGGELNDGAKVIVDFVDGKCYITSRGELAREDLPAFMFESIVKRAGSVEQLKDELDGYNLGLGDKKVTNVTLYQNVESANAGDDSGEWIIQNGEIAASDDTLKKSGIFRVEYERGESWVCFTLDE